MSNPFEIEKNRRQEALKRQDLAEYFDSIKATITELNDRDANIAAARQSTGRRHADALSLATEQLNDDKGELVGRTLVDLLGLLQITPSLKFKQFGLIVEEQQEALMHDAPPVSQSRFYIKFGFSEPGLTGGRMFQLTMSTAEGDILKALNLSVSQSSIATFRTRVLAPVAAACT